MPATPAPPKRVLIIVQNLPVPLDRRVWLECQALRSAGYRVSVICPKGPGDPSHEVIDDVVIYKYRPSPEARGVLGFAWEFAYSWVRTALLSVRVRREQGFDVMQACNPPDTYWALARLWRSRGVRFVYDQHDLNPELFLSRFGEPRGLAARLQYSGLRWLERMTYRSADHVISTNESYRRKAIERGGKDARAVTVVRSGPDTSRMRPVTPSSEVRRGGTWLLVYLGIMGPQDDVDVVLEVMDSLVHRRGRKDVRAALLGFGDCLSQLREQCTALGLDDYVEFTGRVGPEQIAKYLSSADVGVCPDRKTPLNDVSTMNKTMEFMAYALPCVSFDLVETRVSAGDSALYVESGDIQGFADAVERLLDDDELRVRLGLRARERVSRTLDWRAQAKAYVRVYDGVTGHTGAHGAPDGPANGAATPYEFVDLDDPLVLAEFIRDRGRAAMRDASYDG
jgi:glycosyltransferase involved in cell wall biosynthesis